MAEYRGDQAAGLRRLFGRERARIVSFAAGNQGVGKSVLVANLAVALARMGREVLIIDENVQDNIAAVFGAYARHDLQDVVNRDRKLEEVLLQVVPGVQVLPAAIAVQHLAGFNHTQQEALLDSFSGMARAPDVILVDASLDHPLGFSPLGLAAQETVIVVSASGAAITEAYALVKKVSLGYARRDFKVMVSKVRGAEEAEVVFGNMARVTHSRGLARLEYAGYVPQDEYVRQALRLCQPVFGVFPDAPASRSFRTLAAELLNWPLAACNTGGIEQFMQQLLHLSQRIDPIAIYA